MSSHIENDFTFDNNSTLTDMESGLQGIYYSGHAL